MHRYRFRLTATAVVFACVLVGGLVATPTAKAAITGSTITTPTDPTYFVSPIDIATNQATGTFTIAGSTSGGDPNTDQVDIRCYFSTTSQMVAANVPLNPDGSFSVSNVSLNVLWFGNDLCRLRAVPAGTAPADPTPFAGPRIAFVGEEPYTLNGGSNDGQLYSYYIYAQQLAGSFDYATAGGDTSGSWGELYDGFLYDPATLEYDTNTFYGNAGLLSSESLAPTRSELQIDGANAYLVSSAAAINSGASGLPALSYSPSVDPATGNLVIHETDPIVECPDPTYPPTSTSCASFVSAGVTDHITITQDHDGRIAWVTDVFSSTDGQAHALDLLWDNHQYFNSHGPQVEYEFPGESGFSTHAVDDQVSIPATSPGTILIRVQGAADGDTDTGQGAIVYDRPATEATFTEVSNWSRFMLHQTGTVPAGGSTRFRFAYVQAFLSADVASMAQEASNAFLNTLTVSRSGNGSGTVTSSPGGISCGSSCSAAYSFGTSVTLTATPATGSTFTGWSGECSGTGSCMVTTNDAASVTAGFSLIPVTLTVSKAGDGTGTVTSSPGGISCGASCSHAYDYGSTVTLTAIAAKGSFFRGWAHGCLGKGTCTVALDSALSPRAVFRADCAVPKLRGRSLRSANLALKSKHCGLGKVKRAFSTKVKKGHVVSQRPKPGTFLARGAKVQVVLSKGKKH